MSWSQDRRLAVTPHTAHFELAEAIRQPGCPMERPCPRAGPLAADRPSGLAGRTRADGAVPRVRGADRGRRTLPGAAVRVAGRGGGPVAGQGTGAVRAAPHEAEAGRSSAEGGPARAKRIDECALRTGCRLGPAGGSASSATRSRICLLQSLYRRPPFRTLPAASARDHASVNARGRGRGPARLPGAGRARAGGAGRADPAGRLPVPRRAARSRSPPWLQGVAVVAGAPDFGTSDCAAAADAKPAGLSRIRSGCQQGSDDGSVQ